MKNYIVLKLKNSALLFVLISGSSFLVAYEYLYPVGHIDQEGFKLLLLYQKSAHHIELWHWDPQTLEAGKALLSSYTPAGISLLPHNLGYSFIDDDVLRVAYTAKRSPKLIPLYEPLYDFTTVQWLNNERCILSARENERYGIYIIDTEGNCCQVLKDSICDYRYPNLLHDMLYYIHVEEGNHSIKQTRIDTESCMHDVDASLIISYGIPERVHCSVETSCTLHYCGTQAIAFLTMLDEHNGYYVSYPTHIDKHAQKLAFKYHHLEYVCDAWQSEKLFEFSIPLTYLTDPHERLHESILPLLPQHSGRSIYFFDCTEDLVTQLCIYDSLTALCTSCTHAQQSVLGLYTHSGISWYGGQLQKDSSSVTSTPTAWVDDQGIFCVQIPSFKNE